MLLRELFELDHIDVQDDLRTDIMDMLTKFVSTKTKDVTIQQIMDQMASLGSGLAIDRGLVMDLLDPDTNKFVKKIEGDKVYLQAPNDQDRAVDQDQEQKDKEKVSKDAMAQAAKDVKKKSVGGGPL